MGATWEATSWNKPNSFQLSSQSGPHAYVIFWWNPLQLLLITGFALKQGSKQFSLYHDYTLKASSYTVYTYVHVLLHQNSISLTFSFSLLWQKGLLKSSATHWMGKCVCVSVWGREKECVHVCVSACMRLTVRLHNCNHYVNREQNLLLHISHYYY